MHKLLQGFPHTDQTRWSGRK